jgi:hypothetical protein
MRLRCLAMIAIAMSFAMAAHASGHGPVFGFATPVNSQGETSFDFGVYSRYATFGSQTNLKSMVSYGLTPQLQVSFVAPALVQEGAVPMSMMSGGEFQGNVAWRFHHQPNAVGRRFESTASIGVVAPGPQDDAGMFRGMHSAPGVNGWAATGMASRSHYVWIGAGAMHFAERSGDQRPNVYSSSLVYGYRPPSWRSDKHQWDWRVFAEMTGEHAGQVRRAGLLMPGTDANQVFLGPSVLGIYSAFAVSGGVQFPIYSDVGRVLPREHARIAVNVSYFLFSHSHSR